MLQIPKIKVLKISHNEIKNHGIKSLQKAHWP